MGPDRGASIAERFLRTSGDLLADRRFLYGRDLAEAGDHAAAVDLYTQALELAPGWAPGWLALGDARARTGDRDGAAEAYARAAELDGEGVLGASLAAAALSGVAPPAAADPAYVRALFDDYAPRFERHLAESLAYRGPALLRAALDRVALPPARFGRALDLGCGTGLMGVTLRDRVDWLGGVDLSPAMVEAARAKAIYDALTAGDMLDALAGENLDLAVAADVLVYVGDLGPTFRAVAAALKPGGLFAFTVQSAPEGADVVVGMDRRFAHSRAHIRARAGEGGLDIALCEPASTRRDAGRDVPGLLAVLKRSP